MGPTRASGYDWYLVRPLRGGLPFGWVAAADHDTTPWLRATAITCPDKPTLDELARLDRHAGLACYGNRELQIDGMLTSPVAACEVWWSTTPSWLDDCYAAHDLAVDKGEGNPGVDGTPVVELRLSPDVDRNARIPDEPYGMFLPVSVSGHFDDAAAASCRGPAGDGIGTPPPALVVVDCRAQFVGTKVAFLTTADAIAMPIPQVTVTGTVRYVDAFNSSLTRVELDVVNSSQFRAELFASAPDLLPCGDNPTASRTWVEIRDAADDKSLNAFCGLRAASEMTGIWFAVADGARPPTKIYVRLLDRRTGTAVRSQPVAVPKLQ